MRHFQFSLRTLLAVTAWVAFMLGWVVGWSGQFGRWGYWPWFPGNCSLIALGLIAYALARLPYQRSRSHAAILLVLAWQIVCVEVPWGIWRAVTCISVDPPGSFLLNELVQEGTYGAVVSSVTLPLFLTLPLVYGIVWIGRGPLSPTARWLLYALAIPTADVILAVRLVSTAWGTWLP